MATLQDQTSDQYNMTANPVNDVPANSGGLPTAPTTATNPYDVSKLFGAAPDFKAAFTPVTKDQFIETPGAGQGIGHFADQSDLAAHQQAHQAALDYLNIAQHVSGLHDATQQHLDTAGALSDLIGFDHTHPDAEKNLATVRAKYPFARPEAFSAPERRLDAYSAAQAKTSAKAPTDIKDIAALDSAVKGVDPASKLTAGDFLPGSPNWTAKDAQGNPVGMDDPRAATYQKDVGTDKQPQLTAPIPTATFHTLRAHAVNQSSSNPAIAAPALAKPGQKGYKPTAADQAALEARAGGAPQPTGTQPATKPVDKYF